MKSLHFIFDKSSQNPCQIWNFCLFSKPLFEFIEGWYNRKRIHSCLGYMTPQETEDSIKGAA
ncbi:IS3 family transposase [Heyndrickxia coagulans]|uniref:IS3 family transposase n=1 Tax=Heyndrickxia coagulans TaxID=1398 RepID=UPI003531173D